jgi:asparagine synthase (glutamine-hydrolysing)
MWLEVERASFRVTQEGFDRRPTPHGRDLYVSPGNKTLCGVEDLAHAEYCQAVEVDDRRRTVSFGRDYLGHHPLVYAEARGKLFVSDELAEAARWLERHGTALTLSEEAIALYFAMGYVPQGMTLHRELKSCRNASLYRWHAGRVTHESLFRPVAADTGFPLEELGARIRAQVRRIAARGEPIDVWCSGGLDSSIMAVLFNEQGHRAELLTLSYDDALDCAASELRFAREVCGHVRARLRYAKLTPENYRDTFRRCAGTHLGPVVDYLVPLKYALAKATRKLAVTGEGGDPLFSGAKNNFMLYLASRHPELPLGRVHAMAHKRLYEHIPGFLKRGDALRAFVDAYLAGLLERYPGDLVRKLLYANTFEKQGGMIFPKNYYAGKRYGVDVLHPLTGLDVYRAAFSLPDERKYVYPRGKLALLELYGDALPRSIVERRKSGTRLPLDAYLGYLLADRPCLDALRDCGLFRTESLHRLLAGGPRRRGELVLLYGLLSLSAWLTRDTAAVAAAT